MKTKQRQAHTNTRLQPQNLACTLAHKCFHTCPGSLDFSNLDHRPIVQVGCVLVLVILHHSCITNIYLCTRGPRHVRTKARFPSARTGDVSFLRITVTMAGNICYRAADYAGTIFEYLRVTGPARTSCNSQGTL
jgi:hypothetical protein